MALIRTLAQLRTMCKQLSDKENDEHISDSEWAMRLYLQYGELWQIVVDGGGRYFETEATITASGAASYTEESGILQIIEVTRVDGPHRRRLDELMVQERADYIGLTGHATKWEFSDDQIILYPNPRSGTYKYLYIPQATDISAYADADNVDVCCPAGLKFLVWSTVATALGKSESATGEAHRQADMARVDLQMWAANRAATNPRHRVTRDVDDTILANDPGGFR